MSSVTLEQALIHVEDRGPFRTEERIWWIYMRNDVAKYLERLSNDQHIELRAAHQAVNERPETIRDEAEKWEELRHQLVVLVHG